MAKQKMLSEDKQKEIVKYLSRCIAQVKAERTDMDGTKIPEYWSRYRGEWSSKKDKSFPWDGAADFHIPFTAWACTSTESRILNALFSSDHVVLVNPTKSEHEESALRIQKFLDFELTKRMDIEEVERDGTQRQIVEGTRIDKIVYERDKRILRKYSYNKSFKTYATDFIEEVVNGIKKILSTNKIKIERNEKIVYEGNKDYVIPLKDFLWWGGHDVQECDGVAQRLYLNIRQIIDKGKTDEWFNIDKLKNKSTTNTKGQEEEDKRETSGMSIESELSKMYTPYEVWAYYDIDGDGNAENCMFVVDVENGVLLYYTENDNFWGMRPFVTTPLHHVSGMLNGQGMPARLGIANDELDTLHNQVIDNATSINASIVTWIPKLLWHEVDILKIKPGMALPVKSHDAIKNLDLARQAIDLHYQENFVKDILERLAIVTDYSMGREANIERPTASGKAMSLQEFAVNFDVVLRNVRIGFKKRIIQMLRNLYQYMPKEGIEFPVMDEDGKYIKNPDNQIMRETLTRQDLEIIDDLDIMTAANAINAVKGLEQQNAVMLYQTLMSQAQQTGEVSSHGLAENLIKTVDKRAVSKILRDPKEIQDLQRIEQKMQELEGISKEQYDKEAQLMAIEADINSKMGMGQPPEAGQPPQGVA